MWFENTNTPDCTEPLLSTAPIEKLYEDNPIPYGIKLFIASEIKTAQEEVVKIAKDIFVDDGKCALHFEPEWAIGDDEARENFQKYLKERGLNISDKKE